MCQVRLVEPNVGGPKGGATQVNLKIGGFDVD